MRETGRGMVFARRFAAGGAGQLQKNMHLTGASLFREVAA
jgi:hypothetical protein